MRKCDKKNEKRDETREEGREKETANGHGDAMA
jgi:hypothetical protein